MGYHMSHTLLCRWVNYASFTVLSCISLYHMTVYGCLRYKQWKRRVLREKTRSSGPSLIGKTPLIRLASLSEATGCDIYAKCEFMNLTGSSKDRIARYIIEKGVKNQSFVQQTIVEGTSGNTGISLAVLVQMYGLHCVIFMPNDQAKEKEEILQTLGAKVYATSPVAIINPMHYVNLAKRYANGDTIQEENQEEKRTDRKEKKAEIRREEDLHEGEKQKDEEKKTRRLGKKEQREKKGYFINQFENLDNLQTHYETTGVEIFEDMKGEIDAFVMSAGTGGTIAGVSRYLKEKNDRIQVYLVDPPGSSLYYKVRYNVCYTPQQQERTVKRHRYDSIIEGVGIDRLTANFSAAKIDDAFYASDKEIIEMSRYLLKREGLFLGSSSALNCIGAVRAAQKLGPGHTIVTILCDNGQKHITKFWNKARMEKEWNLTVQSEGLEFLDGSNGQP